MVALNCDPFEQSLQQQNSAHTGFSLSLIVLGIVEYYLQIQLYFLQLLDQYYKLFWMSETRISTLSQPKLKNKKSTEPTKQKFKQKKLVLFIFRLAPKIISYARIFCTKLKKKNSHQLLLFPGSLNHQPYVSPDRNQNLIKQYQKKSKDWYPFYFGSNTIFVDNRHLQLFYNKPELPRDFSQLGFGKIVCFGQIVQYSQSNYKMRRKQSQRQSYKSSPMVQKNGQQKNDDRRRSIFESIQQKFQVGNFKNKIINTINELKIQEELPGPKNIPHEPDQQILLMGTDTGYILAVDTQLKKYANVKTVSNFEISSLSRYKNYIMMESKNVLQFFRLDRIPAQNNQIKISSIFNTKIAGSSNISRANFVHYNGYFIVFYISDGTVKKIVLKVRKIVNVAVEQTICEPDKYNPFMNIKSFHAANQSRIILTAACTKQILFYSYQYLQNKTTLLHKLPNPKNPRVHTMCCIEYFPKANSFTRNSSNGNVNGQGNQNGRNGESWRISANRSSKKYADNIEEEDELYVGFSFSERVYFLKIKDERCVLSKRAKFSNQVLKIQRFKNDGILILIHKKNQSSDQLFSVLNPLFNKIKKPELLVIATLLNNVMSFGFSTHTQMIEKIETVVQINRDQDNQGKLKTAFAFINDQLMILTDTGIQRIGINSWKNIYDGMRDTENVQLLNFLILLKKYKSTFVTAPDSIEGYQKFLKPNDSQRSQILLQYYYETRQPPPQQFIERILKQQPQLLIPFILQHKIDNLNDSSKQYLIDYWKDKDERLVQELIMAGCEYGWQMAVKHGWMRALRKIVFMGVDIHFPLLKISSFVVSEQKKLHELDQVGNEDENYQSKCNQVINKINQYCQQMVQYAILAIEYFLNPEEITELEDLKQFLLTLLRPEIIENCIKYQPKMAIKILSKLLKNAQRVALMDKLEIQDFMHYQKQFKHIIRNNYLSVSQCIFSYLSEIYREMTQSKTYTIDQQTTFRELLAVQHAKMIRQEMQDSPVQGDNTNVNYHNVKGKFSFTRGYLVDMLVVLVSHNNEYLKELIHDECVEKEKFRESLECYMEDLLVKIWMDAKDSPVDNLQGAVEKVEPLPMDDIKNIMISLEQANSTNNYLSICIMLDLPISDYSIKILRKFIYSQNGLIQQRLFDWLMPVMRQLSQSESRANLQAELMNHLKSLIEINKEKSRILFDSYFRNKEKEIIKKIDNDPHLQLEYLEMIILDATENQIQLEQYYLNLYIRLLISAQPHRVIKVLEESLSRARTHGIKYDMQQALRVSVEMDEYPEKNKVETFLYEKLGQVQKCIDSYLKILQNLFWNYIDVYESIEDEKKDKNEQQQSILARKQSMNDQYQFKESNLMTMKLSIISQMISQKLHSKNDSMKVQLEQQISQYFKQLTDLIFRQSIKKYEYIKKPLNAMVSFSQQIRTQKLKCKGHYLSMIAQYFGRIIVESFQKNWFNYFTQWLRNQNKIDLNALKKYLFEGYLKIKSQSNLLQNVSFIDKNVLLQHVNQILLIMQKSVYCESVCTVCSRDFIGYEAQDKKGQSKNALLFSCGHLFHEQCIEKDDNGQDYCWQCAYRNQIQTMINHSQINMVALLQKYCLKKSTNMGLQKTEKYKQPIIPILQKRSKRLANFDKRITQLENQIEILDMKLEISEYYESFKNKKQLLSQ